MERKSNFYYRNFLVVLVALSLSGCSSLGYVLGQGVEQWRLFNRARPIDEVLKNPNVDDKTKNSLRLVAEAKLFSEKLGLLATHNYNEYVALDRDALLWAVAASDPLLLKEKTWWFPIVGAVPYKGYFVRERADQAAKELSEEGLDVWVRDVPTYSSLGWFRDPIYSSMLNGPDHWIVNLVIHESLHATVWISGSVDFNERLASFVGKEGSLRWLDEKFGSKSKERQMADKSYIVSYRLGELVKDSIERYRLEVEPLALANKLKEAADKKAEFYKAFAERASKIGYIDREFTHWNNAALLAYSKYFYDESVFKNLLAKCRGDLGRFVRWIKAENEKERLKDAPEDRLKAMAQEETCVE